MNLPYFSIMVGRGLFFLVAFVCLVFTSAIAQQDGFCKAMGAIVKDAPNRFRNIKGKKLGNNINATFWASGIKIPGTINSRFVSSLGLFYEGALLQTRNKDEIRKVYDQYKAQLEACLTPQGYKLTTQNNFYAGLQDYRKLVFMLDMKEEAMPETPPAHIVLEATYSKDMGSYTLVLFIFEH